MEQTLSRKGKRRNYGKIVVVSVMIVVTLALLILGSFYDMHQVSTASSPTSGGGTGSSGGSGSNGGGGSTGGGGYGYVIHSTSNVISPNIITENLFSAV